MTNVTLGGLSNLSMPNTAASGMGSGAGSAGFSDVLKSAVESVNQVNDTAEAQVSNFVEGKGGSINNVMMAVEKADVSFQLMMQVRNKIVSAYQSIENMQF
jgi:flagellar hook-basal body complex protein FliE